MPARRTTTEERQRDLDSQQLDVAFHEAGHAVAAIALGLAVGPATIEATADELGHVIVEDPIRAWERGDGARRPLAEAHAVSLFAGWAVDSVRAVDTVGWWGDFAKARSAIANNIRVPGCSFVGDDFFEAFEERLKKRARALVLRRWAAVERVAAALLERRTLSPSELHELTGGAA